MIYVDPLWLLAIQAMPYVSIYVAFIHATSVGYLSPNTKITLSQCRTGTFRRRVPYGYLPSLIVYDWIASHAKILSSVWRLTQCVPSSLFYGCPPSSTRATHKDDVSPWCIPHKFRGCNTHSVLSWFVGCLPPLFVYDWIAPHANIMSSVWRFTQCVPSSSFVQFTFPIWLWDENAWWWKWSCFRCVINTPLASEVEWKQDWCGMKWNDQCTNGLSTVVVRNGFSGIVTAQNQFQPIVFICLVLPTNATISQCYVIFNNMTTGPICWYSAKILGTIVLGLFDLTICRTFRVFFFLLLNNVLRPLWAGESN